MTKDKRYIYLLCALLLFLVVSPLARQYLPEHAVLIVDSFVMAALVVGVWTVATTRRGLLRALVLIAITTVVLLSRLVVESAALEYAALFAIVVFCLVTAGIALRDVLFGGVVDVNRLMGAICVYLLIGVAWGIMFLLVDDLTLEPAFTTLRAVDVERSVDGYLYYSFVTLTTLGYGDIYPISPLARTLAYLEATVGQLYLTILVAALVGLITPALKKEIERRRVSTGSEG